MVVTVAEKSKDNATQALQVQYAARGEMSNPKVSERHNRDTTDSHLHDSILLCGRHSRAFVVVLIEVSEFDLVVAKR